MTAVAAALHIFGAVVWVGGMFAIYVCLRPALGTLEPPQRLRLMRVTFQKFFPWVWMAILLLLASGYWMLFETFGGFSGAGLHIHLMQGIGWAMIALFVWLFHGPWLAYKRAVDATTGQRWCQPQPDPADHRCQPAARPARRRHRREWPLLGLTLGHLLPGKLPSCASLRSFNPGARARSGAPACSRHNTSSRQSP